MDGKGSRRKSRRRSVRFMKAGSDDKENLTSEVYGSVWLAENDQQQSPSYSKGPKVQPDSLNDSQRLQLSDHLNESGKPLSENQRRSENMQFCSGNDPGQIHTPGQNESDERQSCGENDSRTFQSSVYNESEKILFSLTGDSKTPLTCQEGDQSLSYRYEESEKQQSSSLCSSERVQSSEEGGHYQFIHGDLSEKVRSPGRRVDKESEEIHAPYEDENDKMQQVFHDLSCQVDSDSMTQYQPGGPNESQTDWPGGYGESMGPQSHCDIVSNRLQDPCHSEQVRLKFSGDSEADNQIQSQRCSENAPSWSQCPVTPETMRCVPANVRTSPVSLTEATLFTSDVASDSTQTFLNDSKQEKNTFCITPVGSESHFEMDSETSLDKGFYQTGESSPFTLEKSSDTFPGEAIGLQLEDSVSSTSVDSPKPFKTVADNTACSSASKLLHRTKSSTQPFLYTPVSLVKSQAVGDTSCSDSACTSVAAPPFSSTEKSDPVVTTVSACPVTAIVAPVQRPSIGGFCCTPIGGTKAGYKELSAKIDDDKGAQASENTETLADKPLVLGTVCPLVPADKRECESHGTQPVLMDSEQSAVGISTLDSTSVAAESFLSTGVCSPNQENLLVMPSETDTGDGYQLASYKGVTGSSDSDVVVSVPPGTVGDHTNSSQTLTALSTGTLPDSLDYEQASRILPQGVPCLFPGSEQGEKERKDSKKKRKYRRRSAAFGAELRLGTLIQQGTTDTSVPAWQPEQQDSLDPACPFSAEPNTPYLASESVHEMHPPHKSDQLADGQADGHADVGKSGHQECPTKEDATRPVRSRRKRRSADWSVTAGGSQDLPSATDGDSESPLRSKRRSSLRLYRQQCQRSSTMAATAEDSETKEPLAAAVPSDQNEGSVSSCEEAESYCDSIPLFLEQLYTNKNYKKPADKTWETIFEQSYKGKEVSKQKLKRYIKFEDHVSLPKLKRRWKKAAQNGWNIHSVPNNDNREEVVKKMQELDNELSQMDD